MQEGKQNAGLELVSSQCRKQRLADFGSMGCLLRAGSILQGQGVWALRHDPLTAASFRARMFRPCDGPFTTASFRPFKSVGIYNQSMIIYDLPRFHEYWSAQIFPDRMTGRVLVGCPRIGMMIFDWQMGNSHNVEKGKFRAWRKGNLTASWVVWACFG